MMSRTSSPMTLNAQTKNWCLSYERYGQAPIFLSDVSITDDNVGSSLYAILINQSLCLLAAGRDRI